MEFITESHSLQKLLSTCKSQSGNSTSPYHTNDISEDSNNGGIFSKWKHDQISYPKQDVEWLIHWFLINPVVLLCSIGRSWILLLILICILLLKPLLIRHSWLCSLLLSLLFHVFFCVEINVKLLVFILLIPFASNLLNLVTSGNGVKVVQILLPFIVS